MKKLILILSVFILISAVNAFVIPDDYKEGVYLSNGYRYDDSFSIYNISSDLSLYAFLFNDASHCKNIKITKHHCQYFKGDNSSHLIINSGDDIILINWKGVKINKNIKSMIKIMPKSNLKKDMFYNILNESIDVYKKERIITLNENVTYDFSRTHDNLNRYYLNVRN